jgi:hypothetical protein
LLQFWGLALILDNTFTLVRSGVRGNRACRREQVLLNSLILAGILAVLLAEIVVNQERMQGGPETEGQA